TSASGVSAQVVGCGEQDHYVDGRAPDLRLMKLRLIILRPVKQRRVIQPAVVFISFMTVHRVPCPHTGSSIKTPQKLMDFQLWGVAQAAQAFGLRIALT